jgi:hypothetical protein
MSLKKYKLSEAGAAAAKAGQTVLTKHAGADHRIVMASITDTQAKILFDKGHPFIEPSKTVE